MDMLDHLNVVNELNDEELDNIIGGINLSGTFIKAVSSGINTIMDVGRSFGTSIRRIVGKRLCTLCQIK